MRKSLVVLAIVTVGALTGCASGQEAVPTVTVVNTTTATASVTETATVTATATPASAASVEAVPTDCRADSTYVSSLAPNNDTEAATLQYLKSSERTATYETAFVPAAKRIARALVNGELGAATRYDCDKKQWNGTEGWGGIQSEKGQATHAYAWVYWLSDGTVDFNRGIKGASIDSGDNNRRVQIERSTGYDYPWMAFVDTTNDESGATRVTDWFTGGTDSSYPYDNARSIEENIAVDSLALDALASNMNTVFGEGWQN